MGKTYRGPNGDNKKKKRHIDKHQQPIKPIDAQKLQNLLGKKNGKNSIRRGR